MGELLGVPLSVAHFGHLLYPVHAILFDDYMGVIYNTVNGASHNRDLGTVARLALRRLIALSVDSSRHMSKVGATALTVALGRVSLTRC